MDRLFSLNRTLFPNCFSVIFATCVSMFGTLPISADLVAALLPSSRSAEVGNVVTVFSTVINAGSETATGCQITLLSGLPITLSYQSTDPVTNAPTGTVNTPFDILSGEAQTFVLSITPSAPVDSTEVEFEFSCSSGESAVTIDGVNTLLLSASDISVVDVVALSATAENNGFLTLDRSLGAFALATINLGATDTVTVSADTGGAVLPVELTLCESGGRFGGCASAITPTVETTMLSGATPTFSVFARASGAIANNPATNRVFVRFKDSNGVVRGGTSVALVNRLPVASESAAEAISQALHILFSIGGRSVDSPNPDDGSNFLGISRSQLNNCDTGQIEVRGPDGAAENISTTDLTLTFLNCNRLNGTVNLEGRGTLEDNLVSIELTQEGTYTSYDCSEITFSDVRSSATINLGTSVSEGIDQIAITASGTINGVCIDEPFNCSLGDVDIKDAEALANSCIF